MNWFELALKLLQLAPQIVTLVGAVETAIGPGNGEAKKNIVMAPLAGAPAELHAEASKLVDTIVATKKEVSAAVAEHAVPGQV